MHTAVRWIVSSVRVRISSTITSKQSARFSRSFGHRVITDFPLSVIRRIHDAGMPAKSGLMVGFGETADDIAKTLDDLLEAGCSIVTVGQYLQASRNGFPVKKFYHPDEFAEIERKAETAGFEHVLAGPLVRSSYHAEILFRKER